MAIDYRSLTSKQLLGLLGDELFRESEIEDKIRELALQIQHDWLPDPLHIVPILPGAGPFLHEMLQWIKLPVAVHKFHVSLTGDGKFEYFGMSDMPKKVLIVDDMISSGQTLDLVGKALFELGVEEAQIAVLFHKGFVPMDAIYCNYVGFKLSSNVPVVGWGSDFKGFFRNLRSLRLLKGT